MKKIILMCLFGLMVSQDFPRYYSDYTYFTNEEKAGGAPMSFGGPGMGENDGIGARRYVYFGSNDELEVLSSQIRPYQCRFLDVQTFQMQHFILLDPVQTQI